MPSSVNSLVHAVTVCQKSREFQLTVVVVDVETSLFMFKLRDCLHGRCNEFLKTFVSARYQASRSSLDAKEQTCCRRNLGSMEGIYWSLYWIERIS